MSQVNTYKRYESIAPEIKRLYFEEKMTLAQVGEKFNISGYTVRCIIIGMGLKPRKPSDYERDTSPTKERYKRLAPEIKRLYVDEGKTIAEVRKTVHLSTATVHDILLEMGVKIRKSGDYVRETTITSAYERYKEIAPKIKDLYINQNMSMEEVSKFVPVSTTTVRNILLGMGVTLRRPGSRDGSNHRIKHSTYELYKGIAPKIKEYYVDNGMTLDEVGEMVHLSSTTVSKILLGMNVKKRDKNYEFRETIKKLTPEIIRLYFQEELSFTDVGKRLNLNPVTVRNVIIKNGYYPRARNKNRKAKASKPNKSSSNNGSLVKTSSANTSNKNSKKASADTFNKNSKKASSADTSNMNIKKASTADTSNKKEKRTFSKEDYIKMYTMFYKEKLSCDDIAKHFNCSSTYVLAVVKRMREAAISKRKRNNS